jgi:hypothetical protein
MEKRSRNFKEWKASSSEPKSPSAIDFAAGKRKSGIWTGEDEMQEEQHKRQCTEDLGSVADSHLGASHPNARSERSTSNEGQPGETAHTEGVPLDVGRDRLESDFLELQMDSNQVAETLQKIAQDRLLNVLFTEESSNAFREKFRKISLANKISHVFCTIARGDDLSYARTSDEVIRKADKLLRDVIDISKQAAEELTLAGNVNLQKLLPPELLSQGVFPKKYPKELETYIKDNLETILSNKGVSQKHRFRIIDGIGELKDKEVVPRLGTSKKIIIPACWW